mgnify:CR=1 FL=1
MQKDQILELMLSWKILLSFAFLENILLRNGGHI